MSAVPEEDRGMFMAVGLPPKEEEADAPVVQT